MDNVIFLIDGVQIINGSKIVKITQLYNEIIFDCGKGFCNPSVSFIDVDSAKLFIEKMVEYLSKAPTNHMIVIKINNEEDPGTEKDDKEGEDK